MGTRRRTLAGLLALTVSAGCGDGGDRAEDPGTVGWAGEVRDSAGVRVVENPGADPADPAPWTVREDVVLDPDPGPPEAALGRAVDAVEAPDGSILVLDQVARDVKVYTPSGAFSHVISRPGEGPGELGRPGSLWAILMAGDTVLVPDPLQGRVSRFSLTGRFLGQDPLPGSLFGVRWERDATGRLWVETSNPFLDDEGVSRTWVGVLRYGPEAGTIDTVRAADPAKNHWGSREVLDYPMLVASPVWGLLEGGGLAWGGTDLPHLDVFGPDGGHRLRIVHPAWEARAVPAGTAAELTARYRAYRESLGPSRDPRRKAMHLGQETRPGYASVVQGPEGTLWVQRAMDLDDLEGPDLNQGRADRIGSSRWDVFDRSGVWVASTEVPAGVRVLSVQGDRILGVAPDSLGVGVVRRLIIGR